MATSPPIGQSDETLNQVTYIKTGTSWDWIWSGGARAEAEHYNFVHRRWGENRSFNHPRINGKYFTGGPWMMWKYEETIDGDNITMYRLGSSRAFTGILTPNMSLIPSFPAVTMERLHLDMFNLGAKAYAALKPAKPNVEGLSFFVGLKDYVPKLKATLQEIRRKSRKEIRRIQKKNPKFGGFAAELYVAYYFDYKPFMMDLRRFTEAFINGKKNFDQLLRDEGKGIRRSVTLEGENLQKNNDSFVMETNFGGWNPYVGPIQVTQCYPLGSHGISQFSSGHSSRSWAEGKARYLLPPGPRDEQWKKGIAQRMLGLRIMSPSQLYDIIPWSWLMDYFTGLGDFMSAVDNGVADSVWFDYAYVMLEQDYWVKNDFSTVYYSSSSGGVGIAGTHHRISRTVKMRDYATPFGFGLTSPTDHQMSILGALGYSSIAKR